ncbi:MAG TPA: penicillin-binding protein 2 [Candidatus Polarisedimenticolia bacterium]|nr:penicillin-binding protein 2 [Candidatus Polarisedimenticolia bacterium]
MAWDYRSSKDFKDYYEERRLQRRIGFIFVLMAGLFLAYLSNLWYLQVVNGENYRRLADNNRLRQVVENPLRGVLLDREGRPIVRNRIAFNVLLDREKIQHLDETVRSLALILNLPEQTVRERIDRYRNRPTFEPVIVKEDVDLAEAAYLESRRLEFPEVSVAIEPKRSYEDGDLAAHALGYVGEISESQLGKTRYAGYQLGDVVGKAGLESFYDAQLAGEKGWKQVIVNSLGREMRELPVGKRPVPGNALRLTLDLDLQEELESAFQDKMGSAVFLDPDSGEVLAIVSKPSFDPNIFARRFSAEEWKSLMNSETHPLQNRAIQSKFAPGSVFKIVMAIAALESGKASPARTDSCPGYAVIYGRRFLCHQEGGHGTLAMVEAIKKSCNVYFYHLGRDLGIELISQWAHRLGFGQPTGVDLMHEEGGTVPDAAWKRRTRNEPWYPGETISVSIGQGALEVTPMQMASFASVIGNGGTFYRPHLLRSREIRGGVEEGIRPPEVLGQLGLKPSTLQVIKQAMWEVVNQGGTGTKAAIPDKDVCGKTGTAQVVKASAGVKSEKLAESIRDNAWFVGFAPRDHPRIAFAVFVERGGHGGESAAPIAQRVMLKFFEKIDRPVETRPIARAS